MNCLSAALNRGAMEGKFNYHHRCKDTKLTHLCFADDLLIFSEGSSTSIRGVLAILKEFEEKSGLAFNPQKTSFYPAGLSVVEVGLIQAEANLTLGSFPIRYLGVPISPKKLSIAQCSPLIQSIKTKINTWTVKTLSLAGRLQLVSTVIMGITNFWMSSLLLPKACTKEIDSLCNKFLWKGSIEVKAAAKVAWTSVTKPKQEGGLGIKNLTCWNIACSLKLVWMLFFHQDSIWSTWFRKEVLDNNINNYWVINTKSKNSWMTNKIIKLRTVARNWIRQTVGNGECTYFWYGTWTPFGSLLDFLGREGRSRMGIPLHTTLAELWNNNSWCLPPARTEAQVSLLAFLSTVTITNSLDTLSWIPNTTPSTKFSIGEMYNLLRETSPVVPWHKLIWSSSCIPKQQLLSWLFVLNRCPTRDRLLKWGLQTDPQCLLCNTEAESRDHLFFMCNFSAEVWSSLATRCGLSPSRAWTDTIDQLQSFAGHKHRCSLLLLAWQTSIYLLWMERNNRLHRQIFAPASKVSRDAYILIKNRITSIKEISLPRYTGMMHVWLA